METPEKVYEAGGLKSHRVMGLEDELTPSTTPPNKGFSAASTPETAGKPETAQEAGGVTGFIKSLVGGTPVEDSPGASSETTHAKGDLKDGTAGTVKTGTGVSGAVPTSLSQSTGSTSGAAATEIKPDVSPYAPALESIAGPADTAKDPSEKFGPALDPIASTPAASGGGGGSGSYATGVVSAVSAAAGSAVETIKQAAGYGTEDSTAGTTTNAVGSEPSAITPADLPKAGVVKPHEDGTAEIQPTKGGATPATSETVSQPAAASSVKDLPPVTSSPSSSAVGAPAAAEPASGPAKPAAGTEADAMQQKSNPAVSAFASGSQKPLAEEKKAAEIKEDKPAVSKTGDKPAAAAATTTAKKDAAKDDKAKSSACGCCTIS